MGALRGNVGLWDPPWATLWGNVGAVGGGFGVWDPPMGPWASTPPSLGAVWGGVGYGTPPGHLMGEIGVCPPPPLGLYGEIWGLWGGIWGLGPPRRWGFMGKFEV